MKKIIFLFLVFFLPCALFAQEEGEGIELEVLSKTNPVAVWVEYNNINFQVIRRDFQTWEAHIPFGMVDASDSLISVRLEVYTLLFPKVPINIEIDSISKPYVEFKRMGTPDKRGNEIRMEAIKLAISNRNGMVFSWKENKTLSVPDSSRYVQGIPIPIRVQIKNVEGFPGNRKDVLDIKHGVAFFEGTIFLNIDAYPMYILNPNNPPNKKNPSAP